MKVDSWVRWTYRCNGWMWSVMRGTELTPVRKYLLEKLDTAVHLNPNTRLAGFVVFQSDKLKDMARDDAIRDELEKFEDAQIELKNGNTASVTMHLIEGDSEAELKGQLMRSLDAFFEFYPEL